MPPRNAYESSYFPWLAGLGEVPYAAPPFATTLVNHGLLCFHRPPSGSGDSLASNDGEQLIEGDPPAPLSTPPAPLSTTVLPASERPPPPAAVPPDPPTLGLPPAPLVPCVPPAPPMLG